MDSMFRTKRHRDTFSKTKQQDTVSGTLDSIHQSIVSSMRDVDTTELEDRCAALEQEIEVRSANADLESILHVSKLRKELESIHAVLNERAPIESYYVKNADIMLKYYGTQEKSQVTPASSTVQHTFFKYLASATPVDTNVTSRKELFEAYTTRMKLNTGQSFYQEKPDAAEHCTACNMAREETDGLLICPGCGSEEYVMVVSDFPSFRDPPKERNNYAYKKINHLNEILNQFQAKESTLIPDEVMHEVVCEIKKRRIQNVAELTEKDMREILKKLNRSKYYEHATHILSRLNGNPPPTITPEIEEKIRTMFQEIQAPFLLYCPDDRTNFLSYSYILYKFFELLELDEYKVYFPLLKSRDRLIAHDEIWKKICDYLKWEFIQSV